MKCSFLSFWEDSVICEVFVLHASCAGCVPEKVGVNPKLYSNK
jgi:hypothetical protein